MAFSSDGRRLACLVGALQIDIWDIKKLLSHLTRQNLTEEVSCITASSDGKFVALSMREGPVTVWAMESETYCMLMTISLIGAKSLAFSPNGHRVAMLFHDGTVKVTDINEGTCVLELQSKRYNRQAFSPDSRLLALSAVNGPTEVHDLIRKSNVAVDSAGGFDKVAFFPGSNTLTGASENEFNVFSGRRWKVRQVRFVDGEVALSPDGRWLAYSFYSSQHHYPVILRDITQDGVGNDYYMVGDRVSGLVFSNDSTRLRIEHAACPDKTYRVPDRHIEFPVSQDCSGVHFDLSREWISYMARNILWVPPEFHKPHAYALHKRGFIWTDREGSVRHIEFDPSLMDEAGGWPPAKPLNDKWRRVNPLNKRRPMRVGRWAYSPSLRLLSLF
jgi:hypothetical protein